MTLRTRARFVLGVAAFAISLSSAVPASAQDEQIIATTDGQATQALSSSCPVTSSSGTESAAVGLAAVTRLETALARIPVEHAQAIVAGVDAALPDPPMPNRLSEKIALAGDGAVSVQLSGACNTVSTPDDGRVIFASGLPGTDVTIERGHGATRMIFTIMNEQSSSNFGFRVGTVRPGSRVLIEPAPGSGLSVMLERGPEDIIPLGAIRAPWAYDALGRELPTRYVVSGDSITQTVDTAGATFPVIADPTYEAVTCSKGYYTMASAKSYVDDGFCPVHGWFTAKHGYFPVAAWDSHLSDRHGRVFVRQDGECSWAPDTGTTFDFQVPCKAHDYCWDLIRAGFSGVTRKACDDMFHVLMDDSCAGGSSNWYDACKATSDVYYSAVRNAPGPKVSPPSLKLVSVKSGLCLDIYNGGGAASYAFASLQQYTCSGKSNQQFRIHKLGHTGVFKIKPQQHSNMCIVFNSQNWLWQSFCSSPLQNEARWHVNGLGTENRYVFRYRYDVETCWDVFYGLMTSGTRLSRSTCHYQANQQFYIRPA